MAVTSPAAMRERTTDYSFPLKPSDVRHALRSGIHRIQGMDVGPYVGHLPVLEGMLATYNTIVPAQLSLELPSSDSVRGIRGFLEPLENETALMRTLDLGLASEPVLRLAYWNGPEELILAHVFSPTQRPTHIPAIPLAFESIWPHLHWDMRSIMKRLYPESQDKDLNHTAPQAEHGYRSAHG